MGREVGRRDPKPVWAAENCEFREWGRREQRARSLLVVMVAAQRGS